MAVKRYFMPNRIFLQGLKPLENKGIERMGRGRQIKREKIFLRQLPAFAGDTHIEGDTGDRGKEAQGEAHRAGKGERGESIRHNQTGRQQPLKINQGGGSVIRWLGQVKSLGFTSLPEHRQLAEFLQGDHLISWRAKCHEAGRE